MRLGRWHGFSKTDKAQRIQRRICKLGDYVEGAMFVTKLIRQHRIEQIQISEVSLRLAILIKIVSNNFFFLF